MDPATPGVKAGPATEPAGHHVPDLVKMRARSTTQAPDEPLQRATGARSRHSLDPLRNLDHRPGASMVLSRIDEIQRR